MAAKIVNGYTGRNHVTGAMDGAVYAGIFGEGGGVFDYEGKLAATVKDENHIELDNGVWILNGRVGVIEIGEKETVNIEGEQTGYKRHDLIVARYERNTVTQVESFRIAVIKGERTTGEPVDPEFNSASILALSPIADLPLYRVVISGSDVQTVPLFERITPLGEVRQWIDNEILRGQAAIRDSIERAVSAADTYGNKMRDYTGILAVRADEILKEIKGIKNIGSYDWINVVPYGELRYFCGWFSYRNKTAKTLGTAIDGNYCGTSSSGDIKMAMNAVQFLRSNGVEPQITLGRPRDTPEINIEHRINYPDDSSLFINGSIPRYIATTNLTNQYNGRYRSNTIVFPDDIYTGIELPSDVFGNSDFIELCELTINVNSFVKAVSNRYYYFGYASSLKTKAILYRNGTMKIKDCAFNSSISKGLSGNDFSYRAGEFEEYFWVSKISISSSAPSNTFIFES